MPELKISSKYKSLKLRRFNFAIPLMAFAGITALGISFINYNPEDFASAIDSTPVNSTVSYGDYYLSIASSATIIDLDIDVTASGSYSYAQDDVTVATNAPGYDLMISSTDSSNAGLKLDGTETSTNKIINASSATGGKTGTTAVLSANTYGYAVNSELSGNSNFDASYDNPTATSKWAGIPISSATESNKTIRSTTAATSNTGDVIDVHYGVYANNALYSGDYTGSVVYTAVANAPTEMTATISPTSRVVGSSVVISSGPMVANTATLSNSDASITIGGLVCKVTNINVDNGYLVTTCTVPLGLSTNNAYDVDISVPRYNYFTTITNGFTVAPPCSGGCTIKYKANGGTGSMNDQTTIDVDSDTQIDSSNANAVMLRAQNFSRSNYGFAGWATNSSGTGTIYGPMETIDISSLANNNQVTLYAKWVASAGNIQDFTASSCSSMSVGSVTARTDSRNSETYAIAKLADDKCWMIENLRLGSTSNISITTSNSVTAGTIKASSSSWSTGSSSSVYTTMQQNNSNIIATRPASTGSNATYGYGNYYSWAQAIMSSTSYSTQYQKVSSSLCPKNWHLPTGRTAASDTVSNNEFYALNYYANGGSNVTSSNASVVLRKYPYNFVYSGTWYSSSASGRGTIGNYWSSTVYNEANASTLAISSDGVGPGSPRTTSYFLNKYRGYTVRCLIGS